MICPDSNTGIGPRGRSPAAQVGIWLAIRRHRRYSSGIERKRISQPQASVFSKAKTPSHDGVVGRSYRLGGGV